MKFIFPQNYNFKTKLFGFIDYSTVIFNICWYFLCYLFIKNLPLSVNLKISVFIIFSFPIFLFSIIGFNHENFLVVIFYIIKFLLNRKIYFYSK